MSRRDEPALTKPGQEDSFALGVFVVGDATFFELDLELEELLAHRRVVGELLLGVIDDLLDAIPDTRRRRGDRKREELEQDHLGYTPADRSSWRRIVTKLYGGHGPVYLKFSFPS